MARGLVRLALLGATLLLPCCGGGDGAAFDGPIEDGRHFGYIRAADTTTQPARIDLDVAERLSGEAAQRAAEADGAVAPGEPVSNDYYVRNPSRRVERLTVAEDVTVTRIHCNGGCREDLPGDFEGLAESFGRDDWSLADDYRGAQSQYWVTIEDGAVVAIDEQYVP